MRCNNRISDIAHDMIAIRRTLHQNPQTCYEEVFASDLIAEKLTAWGITHERGWAKTGIVAWIDGEKNDPAPRNIALRADIDALDIFEQSGQDWASHTPGKMHGCGHDGHTSILLGTARYLQETKNFSGRVYLIFQPAEEGGGGAMRMIAEGLFDKHAIDAIYGLHNWPWLKLGQMALRSGPIMACSDELKITITGKGGHAACPHILVDVILVASYLITALQSIVSRNTDPAEALVVSIADFHAGTGTDNVMPDQAHLLGTVRAFRNDIRDLAQQRISAICTNIAQAFGATIELVYTRNYDPTINTSAETDYCAAIGSDVFGADQVDRNINPSGGAEDFGAFLQQKPGCYVFLGQASDDMNGPHNQSLHSPRYDFNDGLLPLGIAYFCALVEGQELKPL